MRLLATAALFVLALPACIELDEELVTRGSDDGGDGVPQQGPSRPGRDVVDTGSPASDATLEPSEGARCDTLLVAIQPDAPVDVEDVRFFGPSDVEVLTFDVRNGAVLVTVHLPEQGTEGANDVLLELAGGDALFLADGFLVDGDVCDD